MSDFKDELVSEVRKFCQKKIEPFLEKDDHEEKFRMDIYRGLGELGICGMGLPEQYGGTGPGIMNLVYVLEELAQCSVSYAVTLSVSTMVQNIINEFGTTAQKEKYLPDLTSGKEIGAFGLTEPGAGSDAAALALKAQKKGDHYLLNGSKIFITSAGIAKTYVIMGRTGGEGAKGVSSFIVADGTPGFNYGKKEKKMGWKVSPTRELVFENCQVPAENLLASEGEGFKIAMSGLDKGRISIGAIAVGLAQRAFAEAVKFSLMRKQFKQSIFDFQGLQFMLADMQTEIMASRHLVYAAAREFEQNKSSRELAAICKLKATDTAMRVTTDALQIFGGVGYTSEYPMERYMRDAKVLQIVEGTNQIQRVVIAKNIKKEYS